MMHIIVVNINNLKYTINLVNDLSRQIGQFKLWLVDQGSTEKGTKEYFNSLRRDFHIEVLMNSNNIGLNRLWNKLYTASKNPYLCFLNNDTRVPYNFVSDTVRIFEKEDKVGCVLHATNHPSYCETTELNYVVLEEKIVQGWAFSMRREAYTLIPDELKTFGGDDWLFNKMYERVWRVAMCLSSPIIHYYAKSRKFYDGDRNEEVKYLEGLGIGRLPYRSKYTEKTPKFDKIKEL